MGVGRVNAIEAGVDFKMDIREKASKVRGEPLFLVGALERASTSSLLSELTDGGLTSREF